MNRFDRFFDRDDTRNSERAHTSGRAAIVGLPEGMWADDGVYRIDRRYSIGSLHGEKLLEAPELVETMRHFGAKGRMVFLDLETTGLSGGTGTYAFLCGLGMTLGDEFNVTQFFLEGPANERAWLAAIDALIPEDATLVTYNGKTFDLPLLVTRHVMTRHTSSLRALPHIDLLHFSRRLYRGYLSSCSLGSMEKNVLMFRRSGEDIPGALIPAMYLQYLRSSDASPLRGVFYHNELDIVSLAVLYSHIGRVLEGVSEDGREILRAGDVWDSQGMSERAADFWNTACEKEVSAVDARMRRAYHAKKSSDYIAARDDLTFVLNALECGCAYGDVSFFSVCEELAKIEEHRFKSPEKAAEYAAKAMEWLKKNRYILGAAHAEMFRSMRHRLERLGKKTGEKNERRVPQR